jgi:rsbT co-antagonist protein RsbR
MSVTSSRAVSDSASGKIVSIAQGSRFLSDILARHEAEVLGDWLNQMSAATRRTDLIKESELRAQCSRFLSLMRHALETAGPNFQSSGWDGVRGMLGDISRSRAQQGFTPTQTTMFVFSAKRPFLSQIRRVCNDDGDTMAAESWSVSELLDAMGLYAVESYQKSREDIIKRQQEELLELSTPVVKLWDGVLTLPVVGTLDSARTQILMESLLQAIVDTNCQVAIIDITGVPTVDTVVAQHLLKTVTAARLMGADCIISGVRPQIAQTIVHLGIDLKDVITKATLSAALQVALDSLGVRLTKAGAAPAASH